MAKSRQIRVLIPYSKTFFFLDGGTMHGVAVELLRDFEKQLNAKVADKSKRIFIFVVPTPRDRLLDDLVSGRGDIAIGNLTITPERKEKIDFADPLLTGVRELIVTPAGAEEISNIDEFSGKSIMVRRSSSYFESIQKLNAQLAAKGLAPITVIEADPRLEDEDILEMVQAEVVSATVVDSHIFGLWKQAYNNIRAHENVPLRNDGQIAWAFRKNSPKLAEVVNRYVAQSRQGTERGNIIYAEYLKSDKWLKKANSAENSSRLQGLMSLFRKYGEMYDIDPFIIAAIAFQESRFDQNLVMKTGARGIMQMMPATARDPNVALPNIENLEENVHAFARYFRFLRERYVNQPNISDFDRLMLLLASYNAGPERIKGLRAKSADPNVWFESVEWAAWKSVGLETVQYVRNVHRYYIVFKNISAGLSARRQVVDHAISD
jgi:membrane-bound lytic murein transglycosylase MltF